MDFVLWVSRVMHVISAVAWIGGLIFMNTVLHPVLHYRHESLSPTALAIRQRFFPFLWSGLWTLFGTGIFLTLLSPRFLWLDVSTVWSQLLTAKVVLFLLLWFVSWQAARVVRNIEASVSDPETSEAWSRTLEALIRRSTVLGIISLLCAAGMAVT
ncbi:MAG: hypothetical protein WEB37_04215 [Bacteroidota bacterium]